MTAPPQLLRACTWPQVQSVPAPPTLQRTCSGGSTQHRVKVDRRAFRATLARRRLNKDNLLRYAQIEYTAPVDGGFWAALQHSCGILLPEARIWQDQVKLQNLNLEAVAWLTDDAPLQPGAQGAEGSLASLEVQILSLNTRAGDFSMQEAVDVDKSIQAVKAIKASLLEFDTATLARKAQRLFARIKSLCAETEERLAALGTQPVSAPDEPGASEDEPVSKGAKVLAMSSEQRQAAECPRSIFIQGRSGTGKTLVLVRRILRNFRKSQKACQVFITKSSLLRADVVKELAYAGCESSQVFPELKASPHQGIVCLTWEDMVAGLRGPRATIDYQHFVDMYWPRLKTHANQLPVLLVWAEFNTRLRTFLCEDSCGISLEEYLKDDLAAVGVRLDRRDQLALHKTLAEYTRLKNAQNRVRIHSRDFDDVDVALQLRANSAVEAFIDALFVDEAQDFSPAQLMLMLSLCKNPDGITVAGDTCQTINPGSAFRFKDIVEAFNIHADRVGEEYSESARQCQILTLSYNYRCSVGVVSLANSVTRLLFARFPTCADPIEEQTVFRGTSEVPLVVCLPNANPAACIMGRGPGSLQVVDAARIAIIVRSNAQRTLLRQEGVKGTILTVAEAKGLEFQLVILCGLLSDCPDGVAFKLADARSAESQIASLAACAGQVIYGDAAKAKLSFRAHSLLCSVFLAIPELKALYVAITRAQSGCVILECAPHTGTWAPLLRSWQNEAAVEVWASEREYELGVDGIARSDSSPKSLDAAGAVMPVSLSHADMIRWLEAELSVRDGRAQKKARSVLGKELMRLRDAGEVQQRFCDTFCQTYGYADAKSVLQQAGPQSKRPQQRGLRALEQSNSAMQGSYKAEINRTSFIPALEQRYLASLGQTDMEASIQAVHARGMQLYSHAADDPRERWAVFEEAHQALTQSVALNDKQLELQVLNAGCKSVLSWDAFKGPLSLAGEGSWLQEVGNIIRALFSVHLSRRTVSALRLLKRLRLWESVLAFLMPQGTDVHNLVSLFVERVSEHAVMGHDLKQSALLARAWHLHSRSKYDSDTLREEHQLEDSFMRIFSQAYTLKNALDLKCDAKVFVYGIDAEENTKLLYNALHESGIAFEKRNFTSDKRYLRVLRDAGYSDKERNSIAAPVVTLGSMVWYGHLKEVLLGVNVAIEEDQSDKNELSRKLSQASKHIIRLQKFTREHSTWCFDAGHAFLKLGRLGLAAEAFSEYILPARRVVQLRCRFTYWLHDSTDSKEEVHQKHSRKSLKQSIESFWTYFLDREPEIHRMIVVAKVQLQKYALLTARAWLLAACTDAADREKRSMAALRSAAVHLQLAGCIPWPLSYLQRSPDIKVTSLQLACAVWL